MAFPKLEEFAFVLLNPSEAFLKELRETIDRLSIPDLRLVLQYPGYRGDDILRIAHALPPLTTIKAYEWIFSASMMELIAQETCFETLTSLEIVTEDTKGLVNMLKTHWMRARQSNNTHTGIWSAAFETRSATEKDISEFWRDIAAIQKQLGVTEAKFTLRPWASVGRPWQF